MTPKAGIQSQGRPAGQDAPANTAAPGSHQRNQLLVLQSRSGAREGASGVAGLGSLTAMTGLRRRR